MLTFRLATFFVLVPVVVAIANSERVASVVFSVCQPQKLHDDYQGEMQLAKDLEVSDQEVRRRIQIKESLIHQLIAGRTTLEEVTTQFLMMNQCRPGYMAVIRASYPGDSDEERTARNVIGYATVELSGASETERAEVLTRLEGEFECIRMKTAECGVPIAE